ncbi:AAA family ATPase [Hydrogenophaga sp. 2FB]|uniref:AAA family ATPase n=1 Tax=Hydrogenophaga sp. 2FB TaxID=2502187 RepID=UPI00207BBE56|nr:AAA family ATPase [Hydrogenophaga sp. 2FB]
MNALKNGIGFLIAWTEGVVGVLAAWMGRVLLQVWLISLVFGAIFHGGPQIYPQADTFAFYAPAFLCGIGVASLAWRMLGYWVLKDMGVNASLWMRMVAPWAALAGVAAMLFMASFYTWLSVSMAYLAVFTSFNTLLAWLVAYGPLQAGARHERRVRTATCATRSDAASDKREPVARSVLPGLSFQHIHGNTEIKGRLKDAAQAIVGRRDARQPARNGILLFGEPGNGKTAFAEALAGELGLPFLQLSHADVASEWVGEKTVRISTAFAHARRQQPCVLFVDEVDSFLEARDGGARGVKEDRDVVNALLTLMVDIRKEKIILVAATNHLDRLDGAGIREGRFDFKVEITPPDGEARIGLLNHGLKTNLPEARVEQSVVEAIARRWNGFSVKRILAVTEELTAYLQRQGKVHPEYEDFMGALRILQGRRGTTLENVKPLSELVLSSATREMLNLISGRMSDPEHTEAHGGTLPTGVLFYGPPGTGKTATVKALAKEIDWAFLPATGADLARDPKELEKLYSKAKELRPCIIFVDEADELLKSREFSQRTEATNKLLTLMDGVNDRVKDVVWIAATNNPEQIDAALLRGGRFTEKVLFERPSAEGLALYLESWFESRKVRLERGFTVDAVGQMLKGESIANAEAVAQAALNRAISRRSMPVVVMPDDLNQAIRMVL